MQITHVNQYTKRGNKKFFSMWINEVFIKVSFQFGVLGFIYADRDLSEVEVDAVREEVKKYANGGVSHG